MLGCGAAPGGALPSNSDSTSSSSNDGTLNNGNPSGVPASGTDDGVSAGKPMPLDSVVQARVRNESSSRCDVTMRFIHDESVVNLSFVRVPPKTVTTVSSPEMANEVELSGLDETGRALESEMFVFGVDFDSGTPAEYVVRDPSAEVPTDEASSGAATLALSQPSVMVTRAVGSTLTIAWNDVGGGPSAIVRLYLRPVGNNTPSQWTPLGPAISAQFDGINDSLTVVVPSVKNGTYEVVGRLDNGGQFTKAIAPGKVKVVSDPRNAAPSLTIVSPTTLTLQELTTEDDAKVTWKSVDPRQTGLIRFSLERSDGTGTAIGRFVISVPIAATTHIAGRDSASFPLKGVLPGLYDLVGTIDDGHLTGTTRVERSIRVLPGVDNDAPQLKLSRPAADLEVLAGGSFATAWKDSDANDDARISFYLDTDWSAVALDGNEQLLQTGVREDPDASGDKLELLTPPGLALGKYRLVGVITDGMTQVVTRAPGFVTIRAPLPPIAPPSTTGGKPEDSGDKSETPKPPAGGGDSADKDETDKSEPVPPGSDGTPPGDVKPDPDKDDDKSDDPGKNPGGNGDPDKNGDGGTTDPKAPVEIVVVIPEADLPTDRGSAPSDVPGDSSETRPPDGDTPAPIPPSREVVVLTPNADLDTNRPSSPSDVPDETGATRPLDDDNTDPPSREIVVLIPNANLDTNRTSSPNDVTGETGAARPRGPGGSRLVASNTRFGGETTVDVTPEGWTGREAEVGGAVRILADAIPNDAWPRTFDVSITDSTRTLAVTSKPIIVPQAVEILDVSVGGVSCGGSSEGSTAAATSVRITWFGGGTVEAATPADVEFWLSADASVPTNGLDDKSHRRITIATGSPNYVRQTELDWRDVIASEIDDRGSSLSESPSLAPGQYRVIAVARFTDFGDITTVAASGVIPVCEP